MMRVRRLLVFLIAMVFLFSGTAYAQTDEELPSAGITSDNPFYFVDVWGKEIGLFFAFGADAKAKKALEYAGERLAEAQVMAAKNKPEEVKRATDGYEEYVAIAMEETKEARIEGGDISEISEIVALATSKHLSVLDEVMDIIPEEAGEAIGKAKEVSINGHKNALRALATVNPERATEINLAAVEGRLNRAKEKVEENEIEEAEKALGEFEVLNKFGEEISQIAQGLGKDTTTVEQLVGEATSVHLKVLAEVLGIVPEQAKAAIERAMEVSVEGHERAVEALKQKGALGTVPEEAPIPEGIPDRVKERILKLEVPEEEEAPNLETPEPKVPEPEEEQVEEAEQETLKPETPKPKQPETPKPETPKPPRRY